MNALTACSAITFNPATLPEAATGEAYNETLTQSGGNGSIAWSVSGALPPGITFFGGTFTGTPTARGVYPLTWALRQML
jgi:hypothetical protein